MKALILLSLLTVASCTVETQAMSYGDSRSGSDEYGQPQNSYKAQQETYYKHNYDTYQNGPLPERLQDERQRYGGMSRYERANPYEPQPQEQQRQGSSEHSQRDTYGRQPYGDKCRSSYGC